MKNKFIICIVSVILAVLTIITSTLFYISKDRINFSITADNGDVYITCITIGGSEYNLSDFASNYELKLNKENNLVLKEGKIIDFSITKLHDVRIIFNKNKSNGIAKISYNKNIKEIDLEKNNVNYYFQGVSLIKLLKNKLDNLNSLIILLFSLCILTFIYSNIIAFGSRFLRKVQQNYELKISNIILCFIIYSVINYICMLPIMYKLEVWYFLIIMIQLIFVAWYFRSHIKDHLQNIFVFFAIILCSNMAILIMPFHVPDEFSHYFKAYSIFNKQDLIGKYSIKIYDSTYNSIYKYNNDLANSEHKISMREYFADFSVRGVGLKRISQKFPATINLNSFAYIPSAIAIKVVLILKLPFIWTMLLARLVNALIFVLLGYLALKIIPYFKKILFLVMLFPITIQQVTGVNQDSLTLSIIFIYIAYILNQIYGSNKKISKKSIILILVLSVCLGMCKPAYFSLALLTILIPKEKFNSVKEKYLVRSVPFILCFGVSATKFFGVNGGSPILKDAVTFNYALHNPMFIIELVFNTIYNRISIDFIEGQLNTFGWLNVSYKYLLSFIFPYLYLSVLLFDSSETKKIKVKERLILGVISIIICGVVYASGLFSFGSTTINSDIIGGLQPRYFIPAVLLSCFAISNDFIVFKIKNKNTLAVGLVIVMFAVVFSTIIYGFYI